MRIAMDESSYSNLLSRCFECAHRAHVADRKSRGQGSLEAVGREGRSVMIFSAREMPRLVSRRVRLQTRETIHEGFGFCQRLRSPGEAGVHEFLQELAGLARRCKRAGDITSSFADSRQVEIGPR